MEQNLTTIGVDFFSKDVRVFNENIRLQIWDTAGEELFKSMAANFYKDSQGILLCYDVTNLKSFKNLDYWIKEIKNNAPGNVPILLVGTKIDLADKRVISSAEGLEFASKHKFIFFEVSSLDNRENCVPNSISMLVEQIVALAKEDTKKSLLITKNSLISKEETNQADIRAGDCCSN